MTSEYKVKEYRKEYQREYYLKNKPPPKPRKRMSDEEKQEYRRIYYLQNRELIIFY